MNKELKEKLKYIERNPIINGEIEENVLYDDEAKEILQYVEKLENIIKEVREYIESNPLVYMYDTDVYVTDIEFLEGEIPELKFFRTLNEILDREKDNE